jgi:hypothetical protein
MFILGGIVLLIIGVLMFCFPDAVYSITELWKSGYSGGPSDSYKVHIRIKSVVVLFLGIFFIVAHFLIP